MGPSAVSDQMESRYEPSMHSLSSGGSTVQLRAFAAHRSAPVWFIPRCTIRGFDDGMLGRYCYAALR